MSEPAKCAHPVCECMVQPGGAHGKFCSDHCKHKFASASQTTVPA